MMSNRNNNFVNIKPQILITRSKDSAEEFARDLTESSSKLIFMPTIETYPLTIKSDELSKLKAFASYDYLIFTSVNGVKYFFDKFTNGNSVKSDRVVVAAVGSKTAEAISQKGWNVDITPDEFTGEGLLKIFDTLDLKGSRILIPGSAISSDTLPKGLKRFGAEVDFIPIYNTGTIQLPKVADVIAKVKENKPDIFVFTSPSSVKGFLELLSINDENLYFTDTIVVAIGKVTEKFIYSLGVNNVVTPDEFTIAGVINLLKNKILRKESK